MIHNEERLFRRIHLNQIVRDEDTGNARLSTAAFKDVELSINLESVLIANGETAENCLRYHQNTDFIFHSRGSTAVSTDSLR